MRTIKWLIKATLFLAFFTTCHQHYNPRLMTNDKEPLKQCFHPIPFVLSPDIPEDIRPLARDGFEFWNKTVGWELFLDMGIAAFPREAILEAGLLLVSPVEGEGLNPYTSLRWNPGKGGCLTWVETIVPTSWFKYNEHALKTMFRHETGHALGLAHNPYKGTLMYPKIRLKTTELAKIRPETLEEIKDLYPMPEKLW